MRPLGSTHDDAGLTFHEFLQQVPGHTWVIMALVPVAPLLIPALALGLLRVF